MDRVALSVSRLSLLSCRVGLLVVWFVVCSCNYSGPFEDADRSYLVRSPVSHRVPVQCALFSCVGTALTCHPTTTAPSLRLFLSLSSRAVLTSTCVCRAISVLVGIPLPPFPSSLRGFMIHRATARSTGSDGVAFQLCVVSCARVCALCVRMSGWIRSRLSNRPRLGTA